MDIQPPQVFNSACGQFYVDIGIDHDSFDEMAKFALQNIRPDRLPVLEEFLDQISNGGASDAELRDLWNRSPADVLIPDIANLKAILAALQREAQRRITAEK